MAKKEDILHLNGQLDVLPYYSKIAPALRGFLKGKKIASKVHLPNFFFLKRGSNTEPLYIEDLNCVDEKMLSLRKNHLKDVREKLNKKQELVWEYFPPRKLIQFFYATNSERHSLSDSPNLKKSKRFRDDEGTGKSIERVFIDIDRRKHTSEEARIVALNLIEIIKNDKEFNKLVSFNKFLIFWTGNSFHVYIILKKPVTQIFYEKYLSYGDKKPDSFIMKWAKLVQEKTKIPCRAGHEKSDKYIIFDSSNTPSGKLARAPFSLHIKDWKNIDGVCVPLSISELENKDLIKNLQRLTPGDILKDLKKYEKIL